MIVGQSGKDDNQSHIDALMADTFSRAISEEETAMGVMEMLRISNEKFEELMGEKGKWIKETLSIKDGEDKLRIVLEFVFNTGFADGAWMQSEKDIALVEKLKQETKAQGEK